MKNDTVRFTLWHTPLDLRVTAGGGSCLWVQQPVYLSFDAHPVARSLNWMLDEPIKLVEALQFAMQYHITDSVTLVEALSFATGRAFAETISFTESFAPQLTVFRTFDEIVKLVELYAMKFHAAPVESVKLIETFAIRYGLNISETIKISEIFSNGKSESFDDGLHVVEHGLLVSQNYFDTNTYFATDYFGESRTW
jgi:hypothetical protein